MMESVFTDQNFETQVLQASGRVLVDFWAPWCAPCQIMTPILEVFAKSVPVNVKIGKVNVDENPQTAQRYNILSIPTLIVFEKGKVIKQLSGVQSKENLEKLIQ